MVSATDSLAATTLDGRPVARAWARLYRWVGDAAALEYLSRGAMMPVSARLLPAGLPGNSRNRRRRCLSFGLDLGTWSPPDVTTCFVIDSAPRSVRINGDAVVRLQLDFLPNGSLLDRAARCAGACLEHPDEVVVTGGLGCLRDRLVEIRIDRPSDAVREAVSAWSSRHGTPVLDHDEIIRKALAA